MRRIELADKYTYRVIWSDEDSEFVGLCAELPSLSWLDGLRSRAGTEIGVGPNVTPAGVALAFAAGVTIRQSTLNVPINLAVVPSKSGVRMSLLTGFTMR